MDMILSIVVGVAVGIASAFATAWLAFRRFQKEKVWERKHAAYVRVLEALHEMDTSMRRIWWDEARQKETEENQSKYSAALEEGVVYAANVGRLILPEAAMRAVDDLREQHRKIANSDCDPQTKYGQLVDLTKSHIKELIRVARKDLGIT